jgi:hypothetical protein
VFVCLFVRSFVRSFCQRTSTLPHGELVNKMCIAKPVRKDMKHAGVSSFYCVQKREMKKAKE